MQAAAAALQGAAGEVPARVDALLEERRKLERELTEARKKLALGGGTAERRRPRPRRRRRRLHRPAVSGVAPKDLKALADEGKKSLGSGRRRLRRQKLAAVPRGEDKPAEFSTQEKAGRREIDWLPVASQRCLHRSSCPSNSQIITTTTPQPPMTSAACGNGPTNFRQPNKDCPEGSTIMLPTLLDLAKVNGTDAVFGLLDEAARATPEISAKSCTWAKKSRSPTFALTRTIKGRQYRTLVRTVLPVVGFRDVNEGVDFHEIDLREPPGRNVHPQSAHGNATKPSPIRARTGPRPISPWKPRR